MRERAPRAGGRTLIGAVTLSHALQHMVGVALPLSYPFAIAEFHVSYTALGATLALAGIAGGVLPGTAGLYRRVPARTVLALQNLALAATSILLGLAPGISAFGAARVASAVAASPQHPVGNAVLARAFTSHRATALSWHATGANVGALAVPLLASGALVVFGWRIALALLAAPLILGALVVLFALRRGPALALPEPRPPAGVRRLREVLLRRSTLVVLLVGMVAAGGRGADVINPYVPAYLQSGLRLPQLAVGVLFTIVLAGGVVGPIVAGHLADRWGRLPLTLAAYAAGALALALLGAAGAGLPLLAVLAALVGVCCYAEAPLLQAVFADRIDGADHQSAFGIYFAVSYGAGSLWLLALGAIIDAWGFRAAFSAMALSFVLAGGLLLLLLAAPALRRM